MRLRQKHAVAVAEKTIAVFDGMPVGGENMFPARKGADQHQEARLRQMEIR